MSNEFIARKGLISLENSQVTGSLSVTQNIDAQSGSFTYLSSSGDVQSLSGSFDNVVVSNNISAISSSISFGNISGDLVVGNNVSSLTISANSASLSSATIDGYNVSVVISDVQTKTGSFESDLADIHSKTGSFEGDFASLHSKTGSFENDFSSLHSKTGSFEASIAQITASYATTGSNTFTDNQIVQGTLNVTNNVSGSASGSFLNVNVTDNVEIGSDLRVSGSTYVSGNIISTGIVEGNAGNDISNVGMRVRATNDLALIDFADSTTPSGSEPAVGGLGESLLFFRAGGEIGRWNDNNFQINSVATILNGIRVLSTGSFLGDVSGSASGSFLNVNVANNISADSASFSSVIIDGYNTSTVLSNIHSKTGSFESDLADIHAKTGSFESDFASLHSKTGSFEGDFASLHSKTGSFEASIAQITASYAVTGSNTFTDDQTIQGALDVTSDVSGSASGSFLNLTVTRNATVEGNLSVTGDFTVDDITSDTGSFGRIETTGNAAIAGDLVVSGSITTTDTGSFGRINASDTVTVAQLELGNSTSQNPGSIYASSTNGLVVYGDSGISNDTTLLNSVNQIVLRNPSSTRDLELSGSFVAIGSGSFLSLNSTNNLTVGGDISGSASGSFNNLYVADSSYVAADLDVGGNVEITGDLTVLGTKFEAQVADLRIEDKLITVASGSISGSLITTHQAGIEVDRGSDATIAVLWNEITDRWQITNDSSSYYNIPVDGDNVSYGVISGSSGYYSSSLAVNGNITAQSVTIDAGSGDASINFTTTQNNARGFQIESNGNNFYNRITTNDPASWIWKDYSDNDALLVTSAGHLTAAGTSSFTGGTSIPDGAVHNIGTGNDLSIYHDGTTSRIVENSNALLISTTATKEVILNTAGINRWKISGSGHFYPNTDNTYDIGSESGNKIRSVYTNNISATSASFNRLDVSDNSQLDGNLRLSGSLTFYGGGVSAPSTIHVSDTLGMSIFGHPGSSNNVTITNDLGQFVITNPSGSQDVVLGGNISGSASSTGSFGLLALGEDTNLYRSAANTLKTDDALHAAGVTATNAAFRILDSGGTERVVLSESSTSLSIAADGHVIVSPANSEIARFHTGGALLINTTSAVGSEKLRVNGDAFVDSDVFVGSGYGDIGNGRNVHVTDSSAARFVFENTAGSGKKYAWLSGTSGQAGLYDYGASAYRLYVNTSGQLGIGTTPSYTLDVSGTVRATGAATFGNDVSGSASGSFLNLDVADNVEVGGNIAITGTTTANTGSFGVVGIGTSSPVSILDISDTLPRPRVIWTDTGSFGQVNFYENTTQIASVLAIGSAFATANRQNNLEFATHNAGDISLKPSNTEVMRLTTSGVAITGSIDVNSGAINEAARFESTDTAVSILLTDSTGTTTIEARDDIRVSNSSGELFRATSDGFGVNDTAIESVFVVNATGVATDSHYMLVKDGSYTPIDWRPYGGSTTAGIRVISSAPSSSFLLVPETNGDTSLIVSSGSFKAYVGKTVGSSIGNPNMTLSGDSFEFGDGGSNSSFNSNATTRGYFKVGGTQSVVMKAGQLGIGTSITDPDGTLHVHTASAGSVTALSNADDLVVENSGDAGISILAPDASDGRLVFGGVTDNVRAQLWMDGSAERFYVGTVNASGELKLMSGNGTTFLTGDSSQNATFAGNVSIPDSANGKLLVGASNDLQLYHDGNSYVHNNTGTLHIYQGAAGSVDVFTSAIRAARFDSSQNFLLGSTSTSSNAQFYATKTYSNSSGTDRAAYFNYVQSVSTTGTLIGVSSNVLSSHTTGAVAEIEGHRVTATASGAGGSTNFITGLRIGTWGSTNASATVGTAYAIYINAATATGTITNRWGVYQAGASENNYFAGAVRVGTTSATSHGGEVLMLGRGGGSNPLATIYATDSNQAYLQFANTSTGTAQGDGFAIGIDASENALVHNRESTALAFGTANSERARIDSNGRFLIGRTVATSSLQLQLEGTNSTAAKLSETVTRTAGFSFRGRPDTDTNLIMTMFSYGPGFQGTNDAGTTAKDIVLQPFGGNVLLSQQQSGSLVIGRTDEIGSEALTVDGEVFITGSSGTKLSFARPDYDTYDILMSAGDGITVYNSTDARTEMIFDGSGRIGILKQAPNAPLDINGNTIITGSLIVTDTITELSTRKVKENIQPATQFTLEKTLDLEVVNYNRIGNDATEFGLIAEDVAKIYPDVVTYGETGEPIGIQYSRLSVILLQAIQEQQQQINELKTRVGKPKQSWFTRIFRRNRE